MAGNILAVIMNTQKGNNFCSSELSGRLKQVANIIFVVLVVVVVILLSQLKILTLIMKCGGRQESQQELT